MIVLGLSLTTANGLFSIDAKTEILENESLPELQLLGWLSHDVGEFRLAETYRALAKDAEARRAAARFAEEYRIRIAQLENSLMTMNKASAPRLIPFQNAWRALLSDYDQWVAADVDGLVDGPAQLDSKHHGLYDDVDQEIEALYEATSRQAHLHANSVDNLSLGGILLACLLYYRVRKDVSRPLAAITGALSKLANGDSNVVVPAQDRVDEIGRMAQAFDVFRANALALEGAHAATRVAQEQAQALARHDPLTGLPNRRVFTSEIDAAVKRARDGGSPCSLLMIDLDKFKPVNDMHGHPAGDLVLCEVANRLRSLLGKNDVAARLGGDEFAVIAMGEPGDHRQRVFDLARQILATLGRSMSFDGTMIEIGATIGIASSPADAMETEDLMRAADLALYQGKRDGRGQVCFFEKAIEEQLRETSLLENDLRTAIEKGDIRPHYQPLVNMKDGRIYGFEMLARWNHPTRGNVAPDVFIPLVEQLGLMSAMTWPLLRQGCRDAHDWPAHMTLSINLSPLQLKDPALPVQVIAVLNQENFSPSRLEIEITESALIQDVVAARAILAALQATGIKISLDDFGTGYSNLYHLRELHFDKIKIDRSFVQAMQKDSESESIVAAVISLARSLGLPAVAEGVETPAIVKLLSDLGCEFGQGYLFGKATSADGARLLAAPGFGKGGVVG